MAVLIAGYYNHPARRVGAKMKPLQFTLRSLLIATTFLAIYFGAIAIWRRNICDWPLTAILLNVGYMSCVWMPLIFVAYALGRRSITWQWAIVFAFAQAAAVTVAYLSCLCTL